MNIYPFTRYFLPLGLKGVQGFDAFPFLGKYVESIADLHENSIIWGAAVDHCMGVWPRIAEAFSSGP